MTAMAPKGTKLKLIREANGDPSRPRRKMPNGRFGNWFYMAKICFGALLVPLWPIFLSIEAREPYYVNHYFETIYNGFRTIWHAFKNRSIGRIFKYNLLSTPEYVEEQLGSRLGACTRCAKCCKMLKCDYLAYDKKSHDYYCTVYNTPYWVFGACGRYPIDQTDIDDYNCPGFAFPESLAAVAAGATREGGVGPLLQITKLVKR